MPLDEKILRMEMRRWNNPTVGCIPSDVPSFLFYGSRQEQRDDHVRQQRDDYVRQMMQASMANKPKGMSEAKALRYFSRERRSIQERFERAHGVSYHGKYSSDLENLGQSYIKRYCH
jgi:hypothetical protein